MVCVSHSSFADIKARYEGWKKEYNAKLTYSILDRLTLTFDCVISLSSSLEFNKSFKLSRCEPGAEHEIECEIMSFLESLDNLATSN